MTTSLVTAPARLPVTLADVKAHLRITGTDEDGLLYGLIMGATDMAERFCNRRLVRQTWKLFLDDWPAGDFIALPFGQLQSVTHVKYTDTDDTESTFSSSYYSVDTDDEPGRIVLDYGQSWPSVSLAPLNPIEVQFVCGYFVGDYWSSGSEVSQNDYFEPTNANGNGLVYQATVPGTTDASTEPAWPGTIGGTVEDNDIIWTCVGLAVPKAIRQAIMLQATEYYRQREPYILGTVHKPLPLVKSLLWPYRVFGGMA